MTLRRPFPTELARCVLAFLPPAVVERSVAGAVVRLRKRHPGLFAKLALLPSFILHLRPSDVPCVFYARTGEKADFGLLGSAKSDADACVRAPLVQLVDLLEGRADGDTLFFNRAIAIEGSAEAVVALRNALESEDIYLFDELLSLFGPFGKDVALAATLANRFLTDRRKRQERTAA